MFGIWDLLTSYSNPTHVRDDLKKLASLGASQAPDQPKRPPHRHRHLKADQIEELIAAYQFGQTIFQLADTYQIDRRTVSAILKREGVRTRWQVMDEATTDRAVQLHAQGLTPPKIAEELDTTAGTVRRALKRRGVPPRPVGTNQWG